MCKCQGLRTYLWAVSQCKSDSFRYLGNSFDKANVYYALKHIMNIVIKRCNAPIALCSLSYKNSRYS